MNTPACLILMNISHPPCALRVSNDDYSVHRAVTRIGRRQMSRAEISWSVGLCSWSASEAGA